MLKTTTSHVVTTETELEFTLVISKLNQIEQHKVTAVRSWKSPDYNGNNPGRGHGVEYQAKGGKRTVVEANDYLWWSVL